MPIASEIIVKVSSDEYKNCPMCSGEQLDGKDRFEQACNHVLSHGLKCLHVGQETTPDDNGKPWHSTVAVFGK
jgi:hypothetical protein